MYIYVVELTRMIVRALPISGIHVPLTHVCSSLEQSTKRFYYSTSVGATGSSVAVADAANPAVFVRVLMIEIFASALGLFGVIVGVIMQQGAQFNVVQK